MSDSTKAREASSAFDALREQFPVRDPAYRVQPHADELRLITPDEGLCFLVPAPVSGVKTGEPPRARGESADSKYLWVVRPELVPHALENGENRAVLKRGYLAHTNLTEGDPAHCGGEMWFSDTHTVVLNGGSGRYPPRSQAELDEVAQAFKACGFRVAHMVYDLGQGEWARSLRGEPEWL